MGRLNGKVAIITGGARGQGAAECKMFAAEGAKVIIGDVLDVEGMQTQSEIISQGGEATFVHIDVSNASDWDHIIKQAERNYGKVNVLVNNAGIVRRLVIEETTEEDWDAVMAVNAKGTFLGTKAIIPAMRRAGGGSIVNISSIAAIIGIRNAAAAYSSSKGAIRAFTKVTTVLHAKDNIRCNSIHTGPIDTPMNFQSTAVDPALQANRIKEIPLGRIGTPDDVAYGVLYLASDESAWVTGIELILDGGITAH
jgi:NAD(P)-dependent dehydrogenase (short-subunit alcohol dehydrogenase family)